jgi:hypothetical protein
MRQIGMRMRTPILIFVVVLAGLVGGCASRATTRNVGAPPSPTNTSGCPQTLTITATDASKTLCVQVGGHVTVQLAPVDQKPWLPIEVSGSNLQPSNSNTASVAPGAQINDYDATTAGTVDITSAYRACPVKPGTISCNAIVAWKVTVQVK